MASRPHPPDPENECAVTLGRGHGAESTQQGDSTRILPMGRPEYQGKSGNARNSKQAGPSWSTPKERAAADDLAALLRKWGRHD
jgi:hypothetical protein